MKKILVSALLYIIAFVAHAQQKPQYTQYVFNNYLLNPAVSGIENYTDFKAGYRSQWTGLDGAPVTSYLTVNAPIGSNFVNGDATGMPAAGGVNPYSRLYAQEYRAAEPHHGIGLMIVSDKAGPISQTNLDATYAYHLGITDKLNLSVGVMAGVNRISLNTSLITLETALDPAIANGNLSQWKPDLGVGVWAYSGNYFVGASVQQLLKQNLYFSGTNTVTQSTTVPHYFFTAGYKIYLTDEVTLLPSVLVKIVNPVPASYDLNLKAAFGDRLWIGGAYRHNDSFSALAGVNVNSVINVGYSYDFTTSNLRTVSNGSHEIIISILFNNRYKVICPQHSF
ncbi:PorP/SprF family type IX secretion system membrane protein [Mucilaginibacter sp.]